ncbi:hypothetical protein KKC13_10950 [bacterium]|nr:hypothetical protein [bacterium]MBU1958187.1 hypothetical protein [bacterium]
MKKIIIASLVLVSSLFAELKVGDTFPALTLVDQFDEKVEVQKEGETKLIISFEKDVSSEIKAFLEGKDKNFLNDNNLTYISDISKMPSLVTSWFALPKMKKFDFKVALIYDEEAGKEIARQEGKVSVFALKNNTITAIDFVEPKALSSILK